MQKKAHNFYSFVCTQNKKSMRTFKLFVCVIIKQSPYKRILQISISCKLIAMCGSARLKGRAG